MENIRRVAALGFFDGVHLGHQALMRRAREQAERLNARPSVITFDAHPDTFVHGVDVPLLTSMSGRKELIARAGGIDDVILLHFDRHFMQTPWEDFIRSVVDGMGAVHLVMGRDFCCGWRGEGKAERIAAWCRENGVGCDIVEQVKLDGTVVSSTHIRSLVAAGDKEQAARFLGHPYSMSDTVVHGYQRGRRMGIPTINFPIPEGVIVPRHGVYATCAWLPDGPRPAVTNVGVRPTFEGDNAVTVETNLLDYNGQLYGASVRVDFLAFLRDEARFPSQQELAAQIRRDIDGAREYFARRERR